MEHRLIAQDLHAAFAVDPSFAASPVWLPLSMIHRARSRKGRPDRLRQAGFALVVVLWASVLIALLAGGVARIARNEVSLARNLVSGTRAELAADSGIYRSLDMIAGGAATASEAGDAGSEWRFGNAAVRVRISDETGRIDMNSAPVALIAALFHAAGTEPVEALILAEAVDKYRGGAAPSNAEDFEIDDEEHAVGAAVGDVEPGEAATHRASAGFAVAEELLQVPGMSRALYEKMESAITVYTGSAAPRRNRAPALVVAALEGRVLSEEEVGATSPHGAGAPPAGAPIGVAPGGSTLVRLDSEAITLDGSAFVRTAVVSLERRAGRTSFRTLLWRRGSSLRGAAERPPG